MPGMRYRSARDAAARASRAERVVRLQRSGTGAVNSVSGWNPRCSYRMPERRTAVCSPEQYHGQRDSQRPERASVN